MGIVLSKTLEANLLNDGVSAEIVKSLKTAMFNSNDPYAEAYAHGMEESYAIYGVYGVYTNTLYLLNNLSQWKGEEARETKKVLKKWKCEGNI